MTDLLVKYTLNPEDPFTNFELGVQYHSLKHTSSAVSFYLRAAERAENHLLRYEALLRAAMCFEEQKDRKNSVEGLLKHAITVLPDRPEAYFYLSRFYERIQNWFEGYFYANLGAQVSQDNLEPLLVENEYPGKYGLLFEKAVCSWHCSLPDVSKNTLLEILYHYKVNDLYKNALRYNFDKLFFK
jgi:tetratricopeptide (TPR) repeat protein